MSGHRLLVSFVAAASAFACNAPVAAPSVTRLTPPSELFASGEPTPVISRFVPGQRFDVQATVRPDEASKAITAVTFSVDGRPVAGSVSLRGCTSGCMKELPANAVVATLRAVSVSAPGVHVLTVRARQSDGQEVVATGNFEVAPIVRGGNKVRNVILMLGDGMGAAQRTAARIVLPGYTQGKAREPLAMDTFPVTGLVKTASLNSIVTDSAPGMSSYVSGNKHHNGQEGVFPDDTLDAFDNPRIEYLSEYLHRTQGKALGIVTTADVFDATPAANAIHTANRAAGTGIVDQFLDDRKLHGLQVLLGGGRRWFLPAGTPESARAAASDYAFSLTDPHTRSIVTGWNAAAGRVDPERDLLRDFEAAGFRYAATHSELDAIDVSRTDRLLGLFAPSNMSVALDKIDGRRGLTGGAKDAAVVQRSRFLDQPMLDEMTAKALGVLARQKNGFLLMVEGASIDKQAHAGDTERWILDTIEFDRAVRVAKEFAERTPGTLVIVTADHETSGAALVGAATADAGIGTYDLAGFPRYRAAPDGYPVTTNIPGRLLVGYGANPGRMQTGQVAGDQVHTATDVPLSAFGPGAIAFTGVLDNTDVFFRVGQAVIGGAVERLGSAMTPKKGRVQRRQ